MSQDDSKAASETRTVTISIPTVASLTRKQRSSLVRSRRSTRT